MLRAVTVIVNTAMYIAATVSLALLPPIVLHPRKLKMNDFVLKWMGSDHFRDRKPDGVHTP